MKKLIDIKLDPLQEIEELNGIRTQLVEKGITLPKKTRRALSKAIISRIGDLKDSAFRSDPLLTSLQAWK